MIVSFQSIPDNNAIYTNSPIIAFVGLDGDRSAVALDEIRRVVVFFEATRADHRVDVASNLTGACQAMSGTMMVATGITELGKTTGSRRVVTMGRVPPKIQYCALAAVTIAARDKSLEKVMIAMT